MIILAATGYLQVRAYASTALIPLMDVAILITDPNGAVIANRLTNRNGLLDAPIPITVPDRSESLQPSAGSVPFTKINLYARLEGYEEIEAENVQLFADTITVQNLEMIPLSEFPENRNLAEIFDTPEQNL